MAKNKDLFGFLGGDIKTKMFSIIIMQDTSVQYLFNLRILGKVLNHRQTSYFYAQAMVLGSAWCC
jgi:hypothetical protein